MIRAFIVDDEYLATIALQSQLEEFPELDICGTTSSALEAVKFIKKLKPQLLFLDVNLQADTGFDVLECIRTLNGLFLVSLALFFILFPFSSAAQEPIFQHFTVSDGLPSSEVYQMHQDSLGYIWFATDRGVSRFDGYRFENFTTEDGLCDNVVFGMFHDSRGRLWFHGNSGCLVYFRDGQFIEYGNNSLVKSLTLKNGIVKKLYVDASDTLWLQFVVLPVKVAPNGSVDTMSLAWKSQSKLVMFKVDDKASFWYNGTYGKLDKESGSGQLNLQWSNQNTSFPLDMEKNAYNFVTCNQLHSGITLLTYEKTVFQVKDNKVLAKASLPSRPNLCMVEDRSGSVWIGLRGQGAWHFVDGDIRKTPQKYLHEKSVSHFLEDSEGNLWFSTLNDGVYMMRSPHFLTVGREERIGDNRITGISINTCGIWVANYGGELNLITRSKKGFKIESKGIFEELYKFSLLPSGNIWARSLYNVIQLSNSSCSATQFKHSYGRIQAVDLNGQLLQSLGQGAIGAFILGENDQWFPDTIYPKGTLKGKIWTIGIDHQNKLWYSLHDGLYELNGTESHYLGENNPLFQYPIAQMERFSNDRFLLVTRGAGLLVKTDESVWQLNLKKGLVSDVLNSVYVENDSVVWACSNEGVSRIYFPDSGISGIQISNYSESDGLLTNEVHQIYVNNDTVWAGTEEGLVIFDHTKITPQTLPPQLHIRKLIINGQDTIVRGPLKLEAHENVIAIQYLGIQFAANQKITYRYKMQEDNANWIYSTSTIANFSSLEPGDYNFVVSASSDENHWSEEATVSFSIAPPFWKTIWFGGVVILLIAGALFIWINQIKKRGLILEQLYQSRHQALLAQMNPHFIFNSLNSIHSFLLSNDKKKAANYLTRFAKLMRSTLNSSRAAIIPLEDEIEMLKNYVNLEQVRLENQFDYIIECASSMDETRYNVPALLIQPIIENAIWHGLSKRATKGHLSIFFECTDNRITCTVRDNGIGRKAAGSDPENRIKSHESVGLSITTKRLELFNSYYKSNVSLETQDLTNDNGDSTGTSVRLSFPSSLSQS